MQSIAGSTRSATDWRLRCAAFAILFFYRTTIPLFGYRRVAGFFARGTRAPPEAYVGRVVAAVGTASRRIPGASCLIQASTGQALFALRGYRVIMRVGVREDGERHLAAHAWLISGDDIIFGSSVSDFGQYRPIADFG
jgi:hypothetical protein